MLSDENLATNYLLSHQIQEALIQFTSCKHFHISKFLFAHNRSHLMIILINILTRTKHTFVLWKVFWINQLSNRHSHIPGGIYLVQSKWCMIIGRVIFSTTNIRPSREDQYISSLTRQHCLVKQAKAGDEHCITATSYLI